MTDKDSNKDDIELKQIKIEKWIKILGVFCAILIVIGLVAAIAGSSWFDLRSDKGLEQFGNFAAGTVAAIWALAGVVLIFIAFLGQKQELLFQKEELRLNRKELEETRKVMDAQKREFELQNRTLSNQNFQNLFFQMLKNYSDIVNHMDLGSGNARASGRDCFKEFYDNLKFEYYEMNTLNVTDSVKIEEAYSKCFNRFRKDISHYFRNLYNFVKLIDRSELSESDKLMYMNILKAQLSTYELALLFYNCLSSYGSRKFKPLVEKYRLVRYLPIAELLNVKHAEYYDGIEL